MNGENTEQTEQEFLNYIFRRENKCWKAKEILMKM
jgi:hypothetical protein